MQAKIHGSRGRRRAAVLSVVAAALAAAIPPTAAQADGAGMKPSPVQPHPVTPQTVTPKIVEPPARGTPSPSSGPARPPAPAPPAGTPSAPLPAAGDPGPSSAPSAPRRTLGAAAVCDRACQRAAYFTVFPPGEVDESKYMAMKMAGMTQEQLLHAVVTLLRQIAGLEAASCGAPRPDEFPSEACLN